MESLPLEMLEHIAQYLTAQDLAACCGVSQRWRHIFGSDALWLPHCDPSQEEYLRTTPCVVEPGFESPEGEDSTLSPVGHWRLAFMRENHLWNNWRQGTFYDKLIRLNDQLIIPNVGFVSNHCFFIVDGYRLEFWDVTNMQDIKLTGSFFQPLIGSVEIVEDHLIMVYNSIVQVYNVNTDDGVSLFLKYCCIFEDEEKVSERVPEFSCAEDSVEWFSRHSSHGLLGRDSNYVVVGKSFIGYSPHKDLMLHVWNIETGTKMKEEICPVAGVLWLISSGTSADVAVTVRIAGEPVAVHLLVYSLKQLKFLPFRVIVDKYIYECVIHKHFIAVNDGRSIRVYNYLSSELLLSEPEPVLGKKGIFVADNKIVFSLGDGVKTFDPLYRVLKSYCNIRVISPLSQKFVLTKDSKLWEVGKVFKPIFWDIWNDICTNKVSSRVVYVSCRDLNLRCLW